MKLSISQQTKNSAGVSLVELLVAVAVIFVALVALSGLGSFVLKISERVKKNVVATNLAQESLEVTRAMREQNWNLISNLTVGSVYHPAKTGSPAQWTLVSGSENISGFSRQVVLNNVYRDSNDDIVASGGTLDSSSKKVIATVSWNDSGQNFQLILISYLTNWKP